MFISFFTLFGDVVLWMIAPLSLRSYQPKDNGTNLL